ncbi:unnamed protein product [Ciceribacter selenitireducens ATCC BAA-1503]|uniref:Uncharacterized protein n=1 Tax=Ciceribacter selenitireducens ATCC BAA-1503 TaxID=1336235 RepID=A0A376AE08_9HYPH|nr:unnamed protein product [Ciceribacter selenitireducens ATCC BAA-1503]
MPHVFLLQEMNECAKPMTAWFVSEDRSRRGNKVRTFPGIEE